MVAVSWFGGSVTAMCHGLQCHGLRDKVAVSWFAGCFQMLHFFRSSIYTSNYRLPFKESAS